MWFWSNQDIIYDFRAEPEPEAEVNIISLISHRFAGKQREPATSRRLYVIEGGADRHNRIKPSLNT